MLRIALKVLFLSMLAWSVAHAAMELSFEGGYEREVYGPDRENNSVERTYSSSLAWYLWETTALEFNYSFVQNVVTEHDEIQYPDYDIAVIGTQSRVEYNIYGIGLRQVLSSPRARFRPMLSIGYAREMIKSYRDITYKQLSTSETAIVSDGPDKLREDSLFGTFILQYYLTRNASLKISVKTTFPAFKFGQARDNIKYLAGFSWMF